MKTAIKMFWGFRWIGTRGSKFEKIRVFKVDNFILPLCLVPKLRSVAQNEWKKHPYIFFSTFGSKINKFERKKSEKNKKKSKNLKGAGNYPHIKFTQYIKYFTWNIKIISFEMSEFCCFWPLILKWRKGKKYSRPFRRFRIKGWKQQNLKLIILIFHVKYLKY